jgi:uncharacterized protein (DUF1697 family)
MLASQLKKYDVVNIGAAGTFVIPKPVSQAQLRAEVLRRLPFEPEVMICSGKELVAAVDTCPFNGKMARSDVIQFVSVLAKAPRNLPAMPLQIPEGGRWLLKVLSVRGRFVFGVYRREMKAIGCLSKMDRLFGSPATTRGWNTIQAILKVLDASPARR